MSKGINDRLKGEREKRGWSQARVAEEIDTDAINVSRWERGYATPSPFFREKLCRLYGKSAGELGFLDGRREEPDQPLDPPLPAVNQTNPAVDRPGRGSRRLASLGYVFLWVSGLFIFLLTREDRFVRFHSLQSVLFFGGSNLLSAGLLGLMGWIMKVANSGNKAFLSAGFTGLFLALALVNLFTLIVWVVGLIQAERGNDYALPFVGGLVRNRLS